MNELMTAGAQPGRGHDVPWALEIGPQDLIDGRYLVEQELGSGGMGVVFRARDVNLDRVVALKMIRPELSDDAAISAFFRQEARALAALRSPHVVPIHAFGRHGDRYFFAMELVLGTPLADILDGCAASRSFVPLEDALEILRGVAAGLDDVHAAGLLHRDVKPANVLIEQRTRRPFLIDFGLVAPRWTPSELSLDPAVALPRCGTPGYMAPEVCLGIAPPTTRTDVYAFACTAFELLVGSAVFQAGSTGALIAKHAVSSPPRASSFRSELAPVDAILAQGLAKDPHERPATCGALARALVAELSSVAIVERIFRPSSSPPPADAARPDEVLVLVADGEARWARLASRAAAFVFHGRPVDVKIVDDIRRLVATATPHRPDVVFIDLDGAHDLALDALFRIAQVHRRGAIQLVVRTDWLPHPIAARLSEVAVVHVLPRGAGLPEIMSLLEAIAVHGGLIPPRGGAVASPH